MRNKSEGGPISGESSGEAAHDIKKLGKFVNDKVILENKALEELEASERKKLEALEQRLKDDKLTDEQRALSKKTIDALKKEYFSTSQVDREKTVDDSAGGEKSEKKDGLVNYNKASETKNIAKNIKGLRIALLAAGAAVVMAAAGLGLIGGGGEEKNHSSTEAPFVTESSSEYEEQANPYIGELENGVTYDYAEYVRYDEKEYHNAFGLSKEHLFGDADALRSEVREDMGMNPEMLASFIKEITKNSKVEQELLGIADMTPVELDNYMSNPQNKDGGELRQKLLNAAEAILADGKIEFLKLDGRYCTAVQYKETIIDGNNSINPQNVHLGQDEIDYEGALAWRLLRQDTTNPTKAGNWYVAGTFALPCNGLQPVTEKPIPGVPIIDRNNPKPTTPETDPTNPTNPTDPTNPTNPTNPTDPTEPTNPTDPTNPTNPTDPTNPTNPTDPTEPGTHPAKNTEAESQYAGDVTPGTVDPSQANSAEEASRIAAENERQMYEEAAKQEEAAKREEAARIAEEALRAAEEAKKADEESKAREEEARQQSEAAAAAAEAARQASEAADTQDDYNKNETKVGSSGNDDMDDDDLSGLWGGGGF